MGWDPSIWSFKLVWVQPKKIMDSAASDSSASWRQHLPAHLKDDQDDLQLAAHPVTLATGTHRSSHLSTHTHVRSCRETAFSGGAFSTRGLLSTQAAALEERVKRMELEDRCRIPGIGRNTRLIRSANYCVIGSGRNSGLKRKASNHERSCKRRSSNSRRGHSMRNSGSMRRHSSTRQRC